MDLKALYEDCPRLEPDYVREVLNLTGDVADKVDRITGGIHEDEAALVDRVTRAVSPVVSLEIGLGYGFSAMAICEASASGKDRRHVIIDPHQSTYWKGKGIEHLRQAGFGDIIELVEDVSYRALPRLEQAGLVVDLAFIDGWHTMDFVMVDFFYVDKLLRGGGVVIFDDADWPSIRPVIRYAITNLGYTIEATLPEKRARDPFDIALGVEGSCIALRKPAEPLQREIFHHREIWGSS
ncbi:hypothetical protein ASG17_12785 [Brevundimonas sp. Leaf363]|uniref:class I SAM-dependent methyltransferase n=1 Tax=Brevundimonas sp. Leaf363 TaxID=1736353 RepID=UPI0006FC573D|nr:class I SAM-dependent methyltransferase [Brevundimonas sp. Leaf363]KQS53836.1 hypothetical protein ASG17_12785 [Brevundimonas sp. Leaf363]